MALCYYFTAFLVVCEVHPCCGRDQQASHSFTSKSHSLHRHTRCRCSIHPPMDLRVRFHLVCVMHDSARVVGVNVSVFVGACFHFGRQRGM